MVLCIIVSICISETIRDILDTTKDILNGFSSFMLDGFVDIWRG